MTLGVAVPQDDTRGMLRLKLAENFSPRAVIIFYLTS